MSTQSPDSRSGTSESSGSSETLTAAEHAATRGKAVMALIAVNCLWGLSFPIVKVLSLETAQHFESTGLATSAWYLVSGSAWIIATRFGLSLALLCLFCRRLIATVRWVHFWAGVAIGMMFFSGLLLQVAGLSSIAASRSGFLTSLVVVWTPIFSTLLQRQLPRPRTIIGAAVSLVGVSILTEMIQVHAGGIRIAPDALGRWRLGDSLTSIAVLFFSFQILLVDYFGKRWESTAFTPSMFLTTAMLAAVLFIAMQLNPPGVSAIGHTAATWSGATGWLGLTLQPRYWILIAILSVFSTLIAFLWMNRYQPVLSAGQAAVIYTLEPLFASSWAMFLPGWMSVLCLIAYTNETVTWQLILGGMILILANAIALWPARGDRRELDPPSIR